MKHVRTWIDLRIEHIRIKRRIRSHRYQLECIALRLHVIDHLLRTTGDPLMDIWDQMRPGLEDALGLTEGSLNSDWDPSGTSMSWNPDRHWR